MITFTVEVDLKQTEVRVRTGNGDVSTFAFDGEWPASYRRDKGGFPLLEALKTAAEHMEVEIANLLRASIEKPERTHVLVIQDKSGEWGGRGARVTLHTTREEALKTLAAYVRERWSQCDTSPSLAVDDAAAIKAYFVNVPERYTISTPEDA